MEEIYNWFRSLWVVWLMGIFVGIIIWTYWPARRARLRSHADIPFHEDDTGT